MPLGRSGGGCQFAAREKFAQKYIVQATTQEVGNAEFPEVAAKQEKAETGNQGKREHAIETADLFQAGDEGAQITEHDDQRAVHGFDHLIED